MYFTISHYLNVKPLSQKLVADLKYFVDVTVNGLEPKWEKFAIHNATGLKDSTYRFLRGSSFLVLHEKGKSLDNILKEMKKFEGTTNQWKQSFKEKCDEKFLKIKKNKKVKFSEVTKEAFDLLKRVFSEYYDQLGKPKPSFKKQE